MKAIKKLMLVVSLFLVTSCSLNAKSNKGVKEIVVNQPTQEALDYREQVVKSNGLRQYLEKGVYEETVAYYLQNPGNVFPVDSKTGKDIELKSKLTRLDDVNSYPLYTLENDNYDSIVLYIHGGAYLYGMTDAHVKFCDRLVQSLNAKVYLPLYPLSSQERFDVAYDYMSEVYKQILKENKTFYIMGDSAGGGFTLGFTEYLKAQKKKTPAKIVLLSPWLDVNSENVDGIEDFENVDLTLACYGLDKCGLLWAGDTDRKDYRISPIYGDLDKLPDILLISGSDELTFPVSMKLFNEVTRTNIKMVVTIGLWHGYQVYNIPERDSSVQLINDFISK